MITDRFPEGHADDTARRPQWPTLGRGALGLTALSLTAWMLLDLGVSAAHLTVYGAYAAFGIVLPGTLIHKALRGSAGSWLSDVALGAAVGLVLELGAWAIASLLDARGALWCWPLLTLLVLTHPRWRPRVFDRPSRPWPLLPLFGVTAAALAAVASVATTFARSVGPPPVALPYPADLLWHMGLVAEARRAFPLQTPQVIGEGALKYHWFADAHLASSSLITGIDIPTVVTRLWWGPMVALGVVLVAVLARQLSGSAWAAAIASLLMASSSTAPFWPSIVNGLDHLNPVSPSQLFAYPLALLTVSAIAEVLRCGTQSRADGTAGASTVAVLGMMGSAGTKPSTLPVLLAGLGVALLAALWMRRDRLRVLALTGATFTLIVVGLALVAGGGFGQQVQPLHNLTLLLPYRVLYPEPLPYSAATLPGLTGPIDGDLLIPLVIAGLLVALHVLPFLGPFFDPHLRRNLGAWLLAGMCASSLVPLFLMGHRGYSQYYFLFAAVPFGSVLWGWVVVRAVGRSRAAAVAAVVTVSVVGASAVSAWTSRDPALLPPSHTTTRTELSSFTSQWTVIIAVVLAITIVCLLGRRGRLRTLAPLVPLALVAPTLVGAIAPPVQRFFDPVPVATGRPLMAQTGVVANWIQDNVPETDVMATNVQCYGDWGRFCSANSWWVSGLGGRRVLLEGWRYTPRHADGLRDFDLYDLNQSAFADPTMARMRALEGRGVRWLVVQRLPGQAPVPADLADYATLRMQSGPIAVYELGADCDESAARSSPQATPPDAMCSMTSVVETDGVRGK